MVRASLLFLFLAGSALAEDRAPFLTLLSRKEAPSVVELKPFYTRPTKIPLREQPQFHNTAAITELGEKLFNEPRLSSSGTMSCATCHNPKRGWTDGLARSVEANRRRSMALYNLAWDHRFTWNGQAGSLMSQAILALSAPGGMSAHFEAYPQRLGDIPEYKKLFKEAFGTAVPEQYRIGPDTVAVALEYYVSTITSGTAPFDRWIAGDENAIPENAKKGFMLFNTKALCAFCHNSWRFSDSDVYDTGLSNETAGKAGNFRFKAVGLRNLSVRPPYMHDGSLATLEEVIQFYNRGGNINRPGKSPHVRPLGLSAEEIQALVDFRRTLDDGGLSPRRP